MNRPRALPIALTLLAGSALLGAGSAQAAPAARHAQAGNRITVRFQLSKGASGSATWSDAFRIVNAKVPDQASGCQLERIPSLHATVLLVQIWPHSVAGFLTNRFKLSIALTRSGGVGTNPWPPTVSLGFKNELYSMLAGSNKKGHVVLHAGGKSGTFDIRTLSAAGSDAPVRIQGSWSCTGLMHITSPV